MCLLSRPWTGNVFGAAIERHREDHSIPERHDHNGDVHDIFQRKRGMWHRIYHSLYDHNENHTKHGAGANDSLAKAADYRTAPVGNDCSRRERRPVMGDGSRHCPGGAAGAVLHQRIPP